MQHTNGQEKITQSNVVMATTTGSGTAPSRTEVVGKWNGTGNVTKVSFTNIDSGDYGSGSEVVVLGCDNDEANSGSNAWQQLGKTTLTAESDDLEVSFTAKKYLMVQANCLHTGTIDTNITFNGSTSVSGEYAERSSNNGGSDASAINRSWIATGGDPADSLHEYFIINSATKEKLLIGHKVDGNTSSTPPQRKEFVAKWTNVTDQITTIKLNNATSGAGFITGSSITVWGFD
jgi:hypothetical protein